MLARLSLSAGKYAHAKVTKLRKRVVADLRFPRNGFAFFVSVFIYTSTSIGIVPAPARNSPRFHGNRSSTSITGLLTVLESQDRTENQGELLPVS
jgi:hypothetical protein